MRVWFWPKRQTETRHSRFGEQSGYRRNKRSGSRGREALERSGREGGHVISVWLLIVLSARPRRVPCAVDFSPSVDNTVSHSSLPRLINRQQIHINLQPAAALYMCVELHQQLWDEVRSEVRHLISKTAFSLSLKTSGMVRLNVNCVSRTHWCMQQFKAFKTTKSITLTH